MKVLITGSGGQLGRDTAFVLEKGGYNPISLDSRGLDITSRERVLDVVGKERPRVIINCAAYTSVDRAEEEREMAFAVNRDGAGNLALAALESDAVLIHISTDFVFDGR